MKTFLLASVCALSSFAVIAQTDNRFKKVDSLFTSLTEKNKFMGSVSLTEHGKTVFEKAYGYADTEHNQKANTETAYRFGSNTKMFTSTAVFRLIEDKKLTLETKLSAFYPKVTNADKITISNLLNHSSGIFNFTADDDFETFQKIKQTKEMMLNRIYGYSSIFEPGAKAEYSNTNYILLGYIIEDITEKTYEKAITDMVFKKAGLTHTTFYDNIDPKQNEAYSYSFNGNGWEKREQWEETVTYAAGALQATPHDLTKFLTKLFEGKIISEASLKQMTTLQHNFGHGIFKFPFHEKTFWGHTGGIEGFRSMTGYNREDGISVAIVGNAVNYDLNNLVIGLLASNYNMPDLIPADKEPAIVTADILNTYAGSYTSATMPLKKAYARKTEGF